MGCCQPRANESNNVKPQNIEEKDNNATNKSTKLAADKKL